MTEIPKTWQFRHEPYVAPVPKTLANVPDDVEVIAGALGGSTTCYVMCRRGEEAFHKKCDGSRCVSHYPPSDWLFVRYLDQPPAKPLSLYDIPDGRCIQSDPLKIDKDGLFWWSSGKIFRRHHDGLIRTASRDEIAAEFTVTDLIAEFR